MALDMVIVFLGAWGAQRGELNQWYGTVRSMSLRMLA